MKLYISGPITGIEDNNRRAFALAQHRLMISGYEVLNPHTLGPQSGYQDGLRWSDYLKTDLEAILVEKVDGVATLPGWYKSPGAMLETEMCLKLDLPIGPEEFWLKIAKGIK